ncbi:MAG: N-acetylornithine carbamoyltransferase [Bacteroidetes bacterium]|nr:N-acetylornithine carbamoyltransferase [Bacteroidota bacterium]
MKNFLSVHDVVDVNVLADKALRLKSAPFLHQSLGKNKTMVLLFLNPSLRTRLSTQKAALNLGMQCIVMNVGQDGWNLEMEDGVIMNGNQAEHIKEAAGVISQYADVIGLRTFAGLTDREKDYAEFVLNQFVKYATVPVVNMESATVHPLQSLADLVTIREFQKIKRPKVVLTWAPHPRALPQAVANSFVEWMQKAEVDLSITNPKGYNLSPEFVKDTTVIHDQMEAFEKADFIYAKNWSSFEDYGKIVEVKENWTVSAAKMAKTNNAYFMHCLPVRRNVVVDDAVIDSERSLVLQQAGNREWAAQAVIKQILEAN